ncbi:MAG TPA: cation:proton antiporter [Acetobacteraceae bacterium]|jgi:CPA2 family monovalent cation:H+ antiporter-2|nr:cation:proton antiporter [Acetobacteraceae bacterium]
MQHEIALIETLAAALAIALVCGLIAARLRLPPLVGYLVAGISIGPFTPGYVGDARVASQLAEIGVILLMFGVGLHFSARDLLAVRWVAIPGAAIEIALVTSAGIGLAEWWGWNLQSGLLFGLSLSVASTVVLLRAFEARGLLTSEPGRLAIGWLVVEDLFTVLLLVALPALAGGIDAAPRVLLLTLAKVGAFVAVMLVVGGRVLPWVLAQIQRTGSRELFTLAVVAIGLGIGYATAELLGLSYALGSFFAGVVLNGSDYGARATKQIEPLQDIFVVLFFVSVGMLVDPMVLVQQPLHVAAVVAVLMLVKPAIAWTALRLLGRPAALAGVVAAGLAQIGEFSFILAALAVELRLLPAEAQDLVLTGAMLAITLNPLMFRLIAPQTITPEPIMPEPITPVR